MKWTVRDGKKVVTKFLHSGVEHNPQPSTARGRRRTERRQQKKEASGIK